MGPAPLLDPPDWDTRSVESRYTEESKVGFDTQVTVIISIHLFYFESSIVQCYSEKTQEQNTS